MTALIAPRTTSRLKTWWVGTFAARCLSCSAVLPGHRAGHRFCSDHCERALDRWVA